MAVLVGIDEAGFGPMLGPLVISSVSFELPDGMIDADLWKLLRKSVVKNKKRSLGRLHIADSKKVHDKSSGLKNLQRAVLACLRLLGKNPANLTELLMFLCPDMIDRIEAYPWYKNHNDHLLDTDHGDLDICADVLQKDLLKNNIRLLDMRSNCVDVFRYNQLVEMTDNKSAVLFSASAVFILHAWDTFGENNLQIVADRQGGRSHYRAELQKVFPAADFTILKETEKTSSYEIREDKRKMRIHFVVKADDRFLPVSLASMTSKYLRELMVENINRYFLSHHSELKPTAGYFQDGRRFIQDLATLAPHIKYDPNQLIRTR
ncbi:MAG: hypothetical protein PHF37_00910 [Phycisphaerae bacterium]|nr:hypothetical protein [Phycisphaerae bacterium]